WPRPATSSWPTPARGCSGWWSRRTDGRPARPPRTVSRPGGGFWHAAGMPRSGSAAPARDQPPAAVTVIVGEEELLVERAVQAVVAQVTAAGAAEAAEPADGLAGAPDVHDVRAADLKPGDLTGLTAPSLFGGGCLVIVRSMQDAI